MTVSSLLPQLDVTRQASLAAAPGRKDAPPAAIPRCLFFLSGSPSRSSSARRVAALPAAAEAVPPFGIAFAAAVVDTVTVGRQAADRTASRTAKGGSAGGGAALLPLLLLWGLYRAARRQAQRLRWT